MILEDDTDWDIRIREQLRDFALSTRALTQPLHRYESASADTSVPIDRRRAPSSSEELDFFKLPETRNPTFSPYGDDWDVLWLGHSAMQIPNQDREQIPRRRVIRRNDTTVPESKHLWNLASPFTLVDDYPEHTRVVHHVQEGVGMLGYAVSRRGARKILHEVALKSVTDAVDILMRFFCEGTRGRAKGICITSQPGFFQGHSMAGLGSDRSNIGNHPPEWRKEAGTDMIKWSVRLNAEELIRGGTMFKDQLPDS